MLEQGGADKIAIVARILRFRRDHPELFADGDYEGLAVEGARADHVYAFLRRRGDESLIVAAARFPAAIEANPEWLDTKIPAPPGRGRDLLSGVEVDVTADGLAAELVFRHLPVAVFTAS